MHTFSRLTRKTLMALIGTLAALAGAGSPISALAQERDVKFMLDFIALGRHAPWYVALAKGYYKEEKLNVTIVPSKGTADAIRGVETGIAELGFIDVPSLVASGSAGGGNRVQRAGLGLVFGQAIFCRPVRQKILRHA